MQPSEGHIDPIPILIVGAGPAGLVLALTLVQNGVPVRVIDKAPAPPVGQRGAGIMPRTLEIYEFLGVLPNILRAGFMLPPCAQYDSPGITKPAKQFDMVTVYDPTPDCPYLRGYTLGQDEVTRIMRSHLSRHGCEVEYGVGLVDFEQHPDAVTVHVSVQKDGDLVPGVIEARWLVGADGGKGIVRKQLGLTFLGETRAEDGLVIADVHITGLSNDYWHMWGDVSTKWVTIRPTEKDGIFWSLSGGRQADYEKLASDPEALRQFVREVSGRTDFELGEFVTLNSFRPNIRMVNKFGEGRVFFNLAWKLALVHKSLAPASLLGTYTSERLPVIAQMLNKTTQLLDRAVEAAATKRDIPPEHLQDEGANPWVRGKVFFQLGVNYRWSEIVVDEEAEGRWVSVREAYGAATGAGGARVYAGDRAPDAPFLADLKAGVDISPVGPGTKRLFDLFKPTHHTVLVFSSAVEEVLDVLEELPPLVTRSVVVFPTRTAVERLQPRETWDGVHHVVKDCFGYAYKHYSAEKGRRKVVIVRPDGVVGAIVGGVEGVKRYFIGVFGSGLAD
ncbi:hypothetical protein GLOTRDRAFT_113667 [Gloeophyllum trabeum ATCC 11539]|uniref:FAD-binding domain-containing protein n=1 Tax=Gloeophyllum trabeum (strain ATCC 11539 / FP-39264 / Madison 617) TaxID=670483 RepID=S7QPK3_GLOTA|nr:uncharacterized protein GLOTRDRAFT_113667 [Gloeophyllum trabeum ATCC 11539]EPQ61272.1 hypothetical protein GLOTRDRAFT_113667 [Gloeophyllum trabeum ATCC 11539]